MNLKKSGDSTGFEPMTSAIPVQCSNQLSYEVTQFRVGTTATTTTSTTITSDDNDDRSLTPVKQRRFTFCVVSENSFNLCCITKTRKGNQKEKNIYAKLTSREITR